MLSAGGFEAVYIGTPHHLHADMACDSLEAGYHTLCEKPVTTRIDHAEELVSCAARMDRILGVNYQYRYDRCCRRLIDAARSGELGELRYAVIHVPWLRTDRYMDGWHASREQAGGGTLLTQASHSVDIAMLALGGKAVRATAKVWNKHFVDAEVEDLGMGILELDNGTVIQVCGSMISVPERAVRIEIHGSTGTAVYSGATVSMLRFRGRRGLVFDNAFSALFRSLDGFRACVEKGRPYRTPVDDSIPVLRATLAMYRASEQMRTVEVDP